MAEVLLINPRKRRRKAKKARRARRNPVAPLRATRARNAAHRTMNPRRRRRRVSAVRSRRRRNPIGGNLLRGLMPMVQNAAIGAVGAVAVDFAMGKLNPMLPDTLRTQPGTVGAGDAVKAIVTVALGQLLSRFTRGMSRTAAQGALTVQADKIVRSFLPATITSQLGYASPAVITQGSSRLAPVSTKALGAYIAPGQTPLLNAYTRKGASPLLNGSARIREGAPR
jgi:hypothetical protein